EVNPEGASREFESVYALGGDAKAVVTAVNEALAEEDVCVDGAYTKEVDAVREAVQNELRSTIGPYGDIANKMKQQLSKDTILLTDVTIPGYTWGNKLVEIHEPRNYQYVAEIGRASCREREENTG